MEPSKLRTCRTKDQKMKVCLYFGDLLSLVFLPVNAAVFRDLLLGGLSAIVARLLYN